MSKILRVTCPDCESTLEIDAETGVVLHHQRAVRGKPSVNLDRAGDQLRRQEQERNERFRQSVLAEKQKDQRLQRRFEDALRRARETPDDGPPLRDFDLD